MVEPSAHVEQTQKGSGRIIRQGQPLLLFVAANARSLIANRGDLIEAARERGWRVAALVPEADYLPAVEDLGIEICTIRLARASLNPVADVRSLLEIRRHVRALRPTAVFSYSAKPVIYGSIAARWTGVGSIGAMVTGLGYAFTATSVRGRVVQFAMRSLYRTAFASAHVVFVQNPDDERTLREVGALGRRTRVVHTAGSGVNLERYPYSEPVVEPLTFTMVGRMLEDKGIREFLAAARQVKEAHPQVRFTLIAPHDPALPRAVPREEAERAAADGVVTYVPGVPDVRPLLREASVLVLPSYREGTPRSVLEAMAMGRAVVTTDAPGCRETVEDGRNGFLVPVKDAGALADAMLRYVRDPALVAAHGREGRMLAEERFDVDLVNAVILEALGIGAASPPEAVAA